MTELAMNFRNRVTVLGLDKKGERDRCPTVAELTQWKETIGKKAAKLGFELVRVESGGHSSVRTAVFATAVANAEEMRPVLIKALDEVAFTVHGLDTKEKHSTYLLGLPAMVTVGSLKP